MTIQGRSLTVHLTGQRAGIDATAVLEVFRDTLVALGELNKATSPFGSGNIEWEIVAAGMSSPFFAILQPRKVDDPQADFGPIVIEEFVRGISQLETSDDCPKRFNEQTLRAISAVARSHAKGVSLVEFSTNGQRAKITKIVSANATKAIQRIQLENARKSGELIEYGTIEGHLKELSEMSGRDKMVIADELTGRDVPCYFSRNEIEQMGRIAWKRRVSIAGRITMDRATGDAKSVAVDEIRVMRGQDELPQIEDLDGIDITGGMESSEYIRGLRDGD